jgi:predicted AAA+ superfamily ATPase
MDENSRGKVMIPKEHLKRVLIDQREIILKKPMGIVREALDEIQGKIALPHIVVITGMRRSGKSTLLRQIIADFYKDENFYYINFEDERLFDFQSADFNDLYELQVELFGSAKTFFIDEIQNVKGFERFVRRFCDAGYKFFITGSNAQMLSKEIGSKLTGRHLDVEVTPFTFTEYLRAKNIELPRGANLSTDQFAALRRAFNNYLSQGGMPEFVLYSDMEILSRIYEDIVLKDIVIRYAVDDIKRSKQLYAYLINNFGRQFTYNGLKNTLHFGSGHTVKNHIQYLEDTFLINLVDQFQFSYKKRSLSPKKSYVIDNGLLRSVTFTASQDNGWLLENFVYNAIRPRGEVFYYRGGRECDFILRQKNGTIVPVQVTWELNESNRERELNGINEALSQFKLNSGIIFTHDTAGAITFNKKKIRLIPVWRWLLGRKEL